MLKCCGKEPASKLRLSTLCCFGGAWYNKQRDLSHQVGGWKVSSFICGWAHSIRPNSLLECICRHRDWHHSCPKNLLHNCRQQFSQQPTQLRWDKGHSLICSNPPLTFLKCQHTDQGDVQPTKAWGLQLFYRSCCSKSCGQVTAIKTMKKGALVINSPAYTHTMKDLSVFMEQWELEPFQLIFASLMFHITHSSVLLSLLEPNLLWCTSTYISSSGTKHLNLQVSSAPHCALKTCYWCAHRVWGCFWNPCPLPQPEGQLISHLVSEMGAKYNCLTLQNYFYDLSVLSPYDSTKLEIMCVIYTTL